MAKRETWVAKAGRAIKALMSSADAGPGRRAAHPTDRQTSNRPESVGTAGATRTIEVKPAQVRDLRLSYAPDRDGDPDAGEIVWTWVPYAENDGRGKDRPVLVIGRLSADRVYAVKLTSKPHDGDHEYLSIGSGVWDGEGRESWVDLDQLYSVHARGMRREAAALDGAQFDRVAAELQRRFGWRQSA